MVNFDGLLLFLVTCLLLPACKGDHLPDAATIDYSFFVAGHTYGKPGVDNKGLHPPFVQKFSLIQNDSNVRFGLLTGDVVWTGTEKNWDEVAAQLSVLAIPIHIAPGNHDLKGAGGSLDAGRNLFTNRFGSTYYSFVYQKDLFILLDPNESNWNITGAQLDFLRNILESQAEQVVNIFVFFHQVLWWDANNQYRNLWINTKEGRADHINFWTEVEPLFNRLNNNVYLFAGDVGAHQSGDEFFYHHYDNIHLIASGMGGEQRDNFLIVERLKSGKVRLRLIALNCGEDIDCLGKLEDYQLN